MMQEAMQMESSRTWGAKTHSVRRAGVVAAFMALVVALCVAMAGPVTQAQAAVPSSAKAISAQGTWVTSNSKVYYKYDGKKATGLVSIGQKTYLFSSSGVQQNGWRKVGSTYRYFAMGNGASGAMAYSKVVNGVKLGSTGAASVSNETVRDELKTMVRAQTLLDSLAKPTDSKPTKLRKCFNYLKSNKITERVLHGWTSASGWHRLFANQIFIKKAGDCYSMGCAMAYLGNAIGYKKCECVSSGGHGWARINGLVYDPEWSAHHPHDYYAVNGRYRDMNYAPNSAYVVNLSRTTVWKGKALKTTSSAKTGLVKKGDYYYYYSTSGKMAKSAWKTVGSKKYYFGSDGKAVKGSKKISGTYYIFNSKCTLSTGSGTHLVTVGSSKYQATKSGKAKSGWSSDKRKYFQKSGKMTTGIALVSGKLTYFTSYGNKNADKSKALQTAAANTSDASKLLSLMGTPKKVLKQDACVPTQCPNGHWHEDCVDGVYTYSNVTIWTVIVQCGDETFESIAEIA